VLLSKHSQPVACPLCASHFVESVASQQYSAALYVNRRFVYTDELIHKMEFHSVRPWDLDFIDMAMKWHWFPFSLVDWRAYTLKKYGLRCDLTTVFDSGVFEF
jgi:hypothetical protein